VRIFVTLQKTLGFCSIAVGNFIYPDISSGYEVEQEERTAMPYFVICLQCNKPVFPPSVA